MNRELDLDLLADAAFASSCSSCGAPIEWARTVDGRPMPFDPEPAPDGELVLDGQSADGEFVCRVVSAGPDVDDEQLGLELDDPRVELTRYRSHWRTCPTAAQHRAA